jgi:uncharacterized membrane protein
MDFYLALKTLHIIGATVLLGTGAGIAFFMVMANRTGDIAFIARTARVVVIADYLFTASAVIAQPLTGWALARLGGAPILHGWIGLSLALYLITGLFWLPVVWMQTRMRDLAQAAAISGAPLPLQYYKLYRFWFASGFPAFAAVLGIVWLMVTKPSF